jgi:hypothetical protein
MAATRVSIYIFLTPIAPCGAQVIRETLVSLQFLDFIQSAGPHGWGINPSQGLYLDTGQNKHRINVHTKHPCPRWDSNPRSQRPSERRQFMP